MRQPCLVLAMQERDPGDLCSDALGFGPAELGVPQIDVVNDVRDGAKPWLFEIEALAQNLERAAVALVRKFGLEHVEPQLARFRGVAFRRNELERRLRVDEA